MTKQQHDFPVMIGDVVMFVGYNCPACAARLEAQMRHEMEMHACERCPFHNSDDYERLCPILDALNYARGDDSNKAERLARAWFMVGMASANAERR